MSTNLPNRAGKAARLEAAAKQVSRAWDRLIEDPDHDGDHMEAVVQAIGELRAALDHPTDDGRKGWT